MTLAELLDAELQLQVDVWTKPSLAPVDEFNFEIRGCDTWHLVTGKNSTWMSSNAQANSFAKHIALENLLLGMVRWVWPWGRSESTILSNSLEDLQLLQQTIYQCWEVPAPKRSKIFISSTTPNFSSPWDLMTSSCGWMKSSLITTNVLLQKIYKLLNVYK